MALSGKVLREIKRIAREKNIPYANLAAVVEVESNGVVSALVNGKNEPLIRWEGHYFDRRLDGAKREKARRLGLANPRAGRVKNPSRQQARWDRLLVPGTNIDERAALESCSWGLGQVMGGHWNKLGYRSVQDMVRVARSGVAGQIELMVRYCEKFGLMDELRRGDFTGFARGYNGPNYKKYKYDTKMRRAASRYGNTGTRHSSKSTPMGYLRIGSKGVDVRALQKLLFRANYAVKVDGDFGPSTQSALKKFQGDNSLWVDGIAGPKTMKALERYQQQGEVLDTVTVGEAATDTPEGRTGIGAAGIGVGTSVASESIQEAMNALAPVTEQSSTMEMIYTGLTIASVVLVIGGLAFMFYGWWKANRRSK